MNPPQSTKYLLGINHNTAKRSAPQSLNLAATCWSRLRARCDRVHSVPLHGGALTNTIGQTVIGGALVFAIGVWLGRVGAA